MASQLTLLGQRQPGLATLQAWSQSLHKALRGCGGEGASHRSRPYSLSPPTLVTLQATAFGLLQFKHSDLGELWIW